MQTILLTRECYLFQPDDIIGKLEVREKALRELEQQIKEYFEIHKKLPPLKVEYVFYIDETKNTAAIQRFNFALEPAKK